MTIKRLDNGGWLVDIQPGGRGKKRLRKTFKAKVDALQFMRNKMAGSCSPTLAKDERRLISLSDMFKTWYELHGINLKAHKDTYARLQSLAKALNNPLVRDFNAAMFAEYRAKRIDDGISPVTLNRERSYVKAVFSELKRLGHWDYSNPLEHVRPVRSKAQELSYLTLDQVQLLLSALNDSKNSDVILVVKILLSTGARWSEVLKLKPENIRPLPGLVTFQDTKSGKNRALPLPDCLASALYNRLTIGPLKPCYGALRLAFEKAKIQLPDGQCAHVLRHTFASHFMMQGGNLLTLQKALGHSSLNVTTRYAHLAPDHLAEVVRFNPLQLLGLTG